MTSYPNKPPRGQNRLRRNRVSIPGMRYFLTVCADRASGDLLREEIFRQCRANAHGLSLENKLHLIALVFMPDHFHAIVRLGENSDLSGAVRLWKGRLAPVLRNAGARWQKGGYFDHRIRPDEPMERILRYMLANPYRKNLLPLTANWPWWYCEPDTWQWFGPTTCDGRPHQAWIATDRPWDTDPANE